MENVELIFTSSEVMHLPEYGSCVSSIHLLCLLVSLETHVGIQGRKLFMKLVGDEVLEKNHFRSYLSWVMGSDREG